MISATRQGLLTRVDELASDLGDPRLRIIDCRFDLMAPQAGREAYLESHVPGAVYADLESDLSGPVTADSGRHPLPTVDAAVAMFSRLGIDADTAVVCYDASGGAIASRAWWLLRWLGHRKVTVLDGGMQAWQAKDLPLESGQQQAPRRDFAGIDESERVLTTAEVAANVDAADACPLVDARDTARFLGEAEPIDVRAGHIPGTRNLPFSACLRDDGTWLDNDALRVLLEPVIGRDEEAPWAVMCGSGVTACHLVISGLLAGYREPRVYIGSWSEWIRDAARPIRSGRPGK